MPTTSLVDYQVLSDANFTLNSIPTQSESDEEQLTFSVPDDMNISGSMARRPLLAFKVLPYEDTSLHVLFDGELILSTSFDESDTRAYWEAVDLSGPLVMHPEQVQIRFLVHNGRARFGDVIMWYQVNK